LLRRTERDATVGQTWEFAQGGMPCVPRAAFKFMRTQEANNVDAISTSRSRERGGDPRGGFCRCAIGECRADRKAAGADRSAAARAQAAQSQSEHHVAA